MGQNIHILNDTIKNNIILNKEYDEKLFNDVLKQCKLDKIVDELEEKENTLLDDRNKTLSGGQLQRIAIARCLYNNSSILLIDEGTSSLDEKLATEVETLLLSKKDLTVVMVTHHLNDKIKEIVDEIIVL